MMIGLAIDAIGLPALVAVCLVFILAAILVISRYAPGEHVPEYDVWDRVEEETRRPILPFLIIATVLLLAAVAAGVLAGAGVIP